MREAMYYVKLPDGLVECRLCPHGCNIKPGRDGVCRARGNRDGILYSLNYGECTSSGMDAIEKKPLYHFYPGSLVLSVGSWGCNFRCQFCQNWQIAQEKPPAVNLSPRTLVDAAAAQQRADPHRIGIAYTYSEPSMWYEFVLQSAKLAKEAGLKNVFVTNGFIRREPLQELAEYLDAVNLDVKAFQNGFYNKICGGRLPEVLQSAELLVKQGVHLELTMLLIPGLNDKRQEIAEFVRWVESVDRNIPVHFTRYHPSYKMDLPATPAEVLQMAWEIGREKLPYVFMGNVMAGKEQNTTCPRCGATVIERGYMEVRKVNLQDGKCRTCGEKLPIVGN